MYRNRQKPFVFENEEEEFENVMFNIGEEPLGKRSPNTLCAGGPLNSMLCRAWEGVGGKGGAVASPNGAESRSSPVFSPNSCLTSTPKVNIGDCGLAFMDHRRWGGAEKRMDKDEYEKRSAEVLMRLSNYKSVPQERNEENEWNALTSYVTSKPVEEVDGLAVAAEDKKANDTHNNNSQHNRSRAPHSSSFRQRQASLKLSSGVMTLEDEEDIGSADLPHNARFNDDHLSGGEEGGDYFGNSSRGSRRAPSSLASSPRQSSSRTNVLREEDGRGGGMLVDANSVSGASFRDMLSPAKKEIPKSIQEAKATRERSVGRECSPSKVSFRDSASTTATASNQQSDVSVASATQGVDTILVPSSPMPKADSGEPMEETTSSPQAQKKNQRAVPIIPYGNAGSPKGRGGYQSRRSAGGGSAPAHGVATKTANPE